jgi:hypothetical protein
LGKQIGGKAAALKVADGWRGEPPLPELVGGDLVSQSVQHGGNAGEFDQNAPEVEEHDVDFAGRAAHAVLKDSRTEQALERDGATANHVIISFVFLRA